MGGGMGNGVRGLELGGLCAVAREAQNGVDSRSGICKLRKSWSKVRFRSETKPRRRRSAPEPENQIPYPYPLNPKTKFLSLTHADDTGLRESRRRIRSESRPSATKPRKLLVLLAAVIAMITSSTASAGGPLPPCCWKTASSRVARAAPSAPVARSTSPKAPPAGSRASIRGPVRSRPLPVVCRRRSPASAAPSTVPSSGGGRCTHWSPLSVRTSAAATPSASSQSTAPTASPWSRTSAL